MEGFSQNFVVAEEDKQIEGPFELHIVFERDDEPLFLAFYLTDLGKRYGILNPKTTGFCAFYGKHPIHIMLSCYMSERTPHAAMITAKQIVEDMESANIRILRTKMEASLNSNGVPEKCSGCCRYYEEHFKVKVDSIHQWKQLDELVKPYGGHLFQNNRSKTKGLYAVVTLRKYNTTATEAAIVFVKVLNLVQNTYFVVSIRGEYGFYDTNPMLDQDWMFSGDDPVNIKYTRD